MNIKTMKTKHWFVLIMNGPKPHVKVENTTRNCVGDFVVWDGVSTQLEVQSAAEKLAPHCLRLCMFKGKKDLGHLTAEWFEGRKQ